MLHKLKRWRNLAEPNLHCAARTASRAAAVSANAVSPVAASLGDLLWAQIGYANRAQEFLLATNLGRMQLLLRRDSLLVLLG
jgi:hypothetical protein